MLLILGMQHRRRADGPCAGQKRNTSFDSGPMEIRRYPTIDGVAALAAKACSPPVPVRFIVTGAAAAEVLGGWERSAGVSGDPRGMHLA